MHVFTEGVGPLPPLFPNQDFSNVVFNNLLCIFLVFFHRVRIIQPLWVLSLDVQRKGMYCISTALVRRYNGNLVSEGCDCQVQLNCDSLSVFHKPVSQCLSCGEDLPPVVFATCPQVVSSRNVDGRCQKDTPLTHPSPTHTRTHAPLHTPSLTHNPN